MLRMLLAVPCLAVLACPPVAGASRRGAHLEQEGIPYITLLANGSNYPDNRGHELFAREHLTFFPAEEAR